jgi:hypothetical protein
LPEKQVTKKPPLAGAVDIKRRVQRVDSKLRDHTNINT